MWELEVFSSNKNKYLFLTNYVFWVMHYAKSEDKKMSETYLLP